MDFYLALLFLVILGGVTLYVLITRVIIQFTSYTRIDCN